MFLVTRGPSRLVISIPHAGTAMPEDVACQLNDTGRAMVDTDWHVDRLYGFAAAAGATVLVATQSRNVVDLNRGTDGVRLYPGQAETGVCPTESFDGVALYDGAGPDAGEIARRIDVYWQPYHAALQAELDRVRALHGTVHLLDGHSIRGTIPRLFEGTLPDLSFGTNGGAACDAALAARAVRSTGGGTGGLGFSQVLDGRFRGGYITRQYGAPADGVQAIQLELAQSTYMDETATDPGRAFDPARAARLMGVLRVLVRELLGA